MAQMPQAQSQRTAAICTGGEQILLRITETVFNTAGEVVLLAALPVIFDDPTEAAEFIENYLATVFPGGKSGYDAQGHYWWGRADSPQADVHRFTIDR
jgi:hypothetical protein